MTKFSEGERVWMQVVRGSDGRIVVLPGVVIQSHLWAPTNENTYSILLDTQERMLSVLERYVFPEEEGKLLASLRGLA